MLQKLRSRHAIDLPYDGFGTKRAILAVLGGILVLFVLVPLLLSPVVALSASARKAIIAVGIGMATLLFVVITAGIVGKFGWKR